MLDGGGLLGGLALERALCAVVLQAVGLDTRAHLLEFTGERLDARLRGGEVALRLPQLPDVVTSLTLLLRCTCKPLVNACAVASEASL